MRKSLNDLSFDVIDALKTADADGVTLPHLRVGNQDFPLKAICAAPYNQSLIYHIIDDISVHHWPDNTQYYQVFF